MLNDTKGIKDTKLIAKRGIIGLSLTVRVYMYLVGQ